MPAIRLKARHEAWRDNTSYARREHVHGRIVPMDGDESSVARLAREARALGEPGILTGAALILLLAAVCTGLLVAFGL